MPQFGFGPFSGGHWSQLLGSLGSFAPATIKPSAQWAGSPGTGFAIVPSDPARTTAKPAMRLLEPPNQYFTRKLVVGVIAFANDGGTLIGGIDRVRFHFEGSTLDVIEPSFRSIKHADGSQYQCLGYWVSLGVPQVMRGHAHLYIEAIPADATMQSRVIGPYQFSLQDALHDHSITVAPSQPAVVGTNYHTIGAALGYLAEQAADNPLITITEPLTEDLAVSDTTVAPHIGAGYCTITAQAPVTISRAEYTTDAAAEIAVKWNRLRFKGSNITFDMEHVAALGQPGGAVGNSGEHWLDGVTFMNSAGRYALWRKGQRALSYMVEGNPYFTECTFIDVPDCVNQALLARGCKVTRGYNDFAGDGRCLVYNRIDDFDSTDGWAVDVNAMQVTYAGSESTATFAATGTNPKTFTARWGTNTATFVVGRTEPFFTGASGNGYSVQDVADWINSLAGWSATVLDDTRVAQSLTLPLTNNNGFSARNVKGVTLLLTTFIDLHGDFFQHRFGPNDENYIIAFNSGINHRGQNIFVSGDGAMRDFVAVGNAFSNKVTNPPSPGFYTTNGTSFTSQIGRTVQSHVIFAHNSMPTQDLRLNVTSGANPDGYCLIANNAFRNIFWSGTPDTDLMITGNVIDAGRTNPSGATGTLITGTYLTKFASSLLGDFTPIGDLLPSLATPVVRHDLAGQVRPVPDVRGAVSLGEIE